MSDAKLANTDLPGPGQSGSTAVPKTQKIVFRDLILTANLGITKEERAEPQRICVNLELEVSPCRPRSDRIDEVISYSDLARQVRAICTEDAKTNLLETLAARIADACLADSRVRSVQIRIEKIDRYRDMSGVGVDITFERSPD